MFIGGGFKSLGRYLLNENFSIISYLNPLDIMKWSILILKCCFFKTL